MPVKLVALDLDDTLLTDSLEIPAATRSVLEAVQAQGTLITLATGRMYRSALRYALELEMDVPLITYQGALVKHAVSGEVLYYKPVPGEASRQVAAYVRGQGLHYQCYYNDELYMESLTPEGRDYAELVGVEPIIEPDLIRRLGTELDTTKLIIVNYDVPSLIEMEKELKRRFGSAVHITRSKPYYVEILNPAATKGMALQAVAAHYGLERHEVMAIGDSYNDIEMIAWAGIGVAVDNAHAQVKAAADYVTVSNQEEGVARALERFVLR